MSIADYIEKHLLPCHFKLITGFDCLGCGLQRATIALLRGHLKESLQMFPALLPLLFTVCFTLLHLKMKWAYGALITKWSFVITICIMVVGYIAKNI